MILCGDSMGMICYGYSGILPVTMEQMIDHITKAVRHGAPNTFLWVICHSVPIKKACRAQYITRFDSSKRSVVTQVSLKVVDTVVPQIKVISEAGVVVISHLGLTPQSVGVLGGFKTISLLGTCLSYQRRSRRI
jgi:3-methyl-2-oxobutanoate hydroxymethyltransferase